VNVLFLTHRLPYAPNRGDRIRAHYLLREMSRFARVSLFSFLHDDEEAEQVKRMRWAARVETIRAPRLRNAVKAAAALTSRRPLTHCLLDAPNVAEVLTRLAAETCPDVVVAYCSGMARFALEEPLAGIPFVLDMVDVDSAKWSAMARTARVPQRWIYRREAATLGAFEADATRKSAATLVVNERERQELLALVPDGNVIAVSNGVDLDNFRRPEPGASTKEVIFCGVMDYFPNEDGVLWFAANVWPAIRDAVPDARFVVVGAKPTPAIKELSQRDGSIEVTGRVDAVQPYLWRAAVSVAPLRLARGLQNKVLEAFASGLPVVATFAVVNGLPDSMRPECRTHDEPKAFANAVIELLRQPAEARRARAAAAPLAALDWSERLQSVEGILRQAARTSRARRARPT
jgi:polysaccharide biosynthesis protein PslH